MNRSVLERLDSFPYRHRVVDVMTSPVLMLRPEETLAEASALMVERGVSSVLVADTPETLSVPLGIVTERDVLRQLTEAGPSALERPLSQVMCSPVASVGDDAFVYLALGRMDRLGIRHLVVADDQGRAVGILSARQLLRQRAGTALALGDRVAVAKTPADLAEALRSLPRLAEALLAEQVAPRDIAAVISGVMQDMTGRAAFLAEDSMRATGWPEAPAAWCVLILGSAGRGESLLAPDQDNAIIHAGKPVDDPWYAEAGRRIADTLHLAGIPYCKGGVMASNGEWRHDETGWRRVVDGWGNRPIGENLLNVDIFFDFQAVAGDQDLASLLRAYALNRVGKSPGFLRNLSLNLREMRPPLGFFGDLQTVDGRVDLKIGGLLPLVAAARLLSLRSGNPSTATPDRLEGAVAAGLITEADASDLAGAHRILVRYVLEQQIIDLVEGKPPSTKVDATRLTRPQRRLLRDVLRRIGHLPEMIQDALAV
ncbi:MAG: CBS domain-containing protein [Alphaproteobacteria bacterium]|nr:CBS domain-containing protein [Alphaproteobacteria bacterium]MBU0795648.1 CBS domain-containing protein [Alphaproteobacteria bacterium]MBU0887271.1 CBS domain-containing protein [Alphaproteobacteria bacterium]MBU1811848.1 CBS domain-containing protein [Alphaproteobacteria bacterium]